MNLKKKRIFILLIVVVVFIFLNILPAFVSAYFYHKDINCLGYEGNFKIAEIIYCKGVKDTIIDGQNALSLPFSVISLFKTKCSGGMFGLTSCDLWIRFYVLLFPVFYYFLIKKYPFKKK